MRRHERKAVELPVWVSDTVADPADVGTRIEGGLELDMRDLSAGGAFVRSDLLFELGEVVGISFRIPPEREVHARARVTRVVREQNGDAPGMGIEFLDLDEDDRAALRTYLAHVA
jgi:uncharacterized protein (TIGR02266 family)